MAGGGTTGILILDACVLIDYVETDPTVLGTVSMHVAPIAIARPVFEEVVGLDDDAAVSLRLQIIDVDLDLATEAARSTSRLSFQDHLCLLLAKQAGWSCVTNDRALRAACTAEDIAVLWGLEIMLQACVAGAMMPDEARRVALAIHEQNPRYVTQAIVRSFSEKLAETLK